MIQTCENFCFIFREDSNWLEIGVPLKPNSSAISLFKIELEAPVSKRKVLGRSPTVTGRLNNRELGTGWSFTEACPRLEVVGILAPEVVNKSSINSLALGLIVPSGFNIITSMVHSIDAPCISSRENCSRLERAFLRHCLNSWINSWARSLSDKDGFCARLSIRSSWFLRHSSNAASRPAACFERTS